MAHAVPTSQSIENRFKNYLPWYIKTTGEVANALFVAIGSVLSTMYSEIIGIVNFYIVMPFIELEAKDSHILTSGFEGSGLVTPLADRFNLHLERGTIGLTHGILSDVKRVANDSSATVTFVPETETGWWLGSTYPDIQGVGEGPRLFLELGKLAEISVHDNSNHQRVELETLIAHEIVPADMDITLTFLPFTSGSAIWQTWGDDIPFPGGQQFNEFP